jgi:hypothetical protein
LGSSTTGVFSAVVLGLCVPEITGASSAFCVATGTDELAGCVLCCEACTPPPPPPPEVSSIKMAFFAGGGGTISVKPQQIMKTINNNMVMAVTPADMILFFFSWSILHWY